MDAQRLQDAPGFVAFWTASTVSFLGTAVTTLAVQVLVVVTLRGGSTGVGLVNAARWLPYLLFGLVAGVLVDRVLRRPLLIGTDLGRAVLLVGVPALAMTGHLTLVLLMVFLAVFGLLSLLNDAADQSYLPSIVPPALIVRASARLDQSGAVAQTAGPALAGGLVWLLTAPVAVLVDAVSYLPSAVLLLRVPAVEPPSRSLSLRGVGREALEGLRRVYRHPTLTPFAVATHAWFVCNAVGGAVLVPFALLTLHLSSFGLGIALAVGGVGALVGSMLSTRLGRRSGVGPVVITCTTGTAVSWAVMASSPGAWVGWCVFGAGQLLLGATMGAQNPNEMGYRQSVTPDRLQGRMSATMRSINRAVVVVGAPLGGLLGDAVGFCPDGRECVDEGGEYATFVHDLCRRPDLRGGGQQLDGLLPQPGVGGHRAAGGGTDDLQQLVRRQLRLLAQGEDALACDERAHHQTEEGNRPPPRRSARASSRRRPDRAPAR